MALPDEPVPDPEGLKAAREYARWHLGSAVWASDILWAYMHPNECMVRLNETPGYGK